jgi:tetratricopeptide (TPR) repeat protein
VSSDSEQLLPPNEPAAFESLCLDLWRDIWGDPGAQKNGRPGQPQAGVDVYGQHDGGWVGVQCKQKDGLLRTKVTVKELDAEVAAARSFQPALRRFILATSGRRDAKVQQRARELTKQGELDVEVWSWQDIWPEIHGRRKLFERIFPIYWPLQAGVRRRRVRPTVLKHIAETLFGREQELQRLDATWNDPTKHVVTLVAWGGVGKTSLVAKWAAELAARDYDGADYFDWSFYSQGTREQGGESADAFIDAALRFFGDETLADSPSSPWEKGARFAQLVAERRTLLVLDGLEPLQHPPGPLAGELKDPAITTLLKRLAQSNRGLCVVTTREQVKDLAAFRQSTALEWELEHLSTDAGVALLKSLKVHGSERDLRQLVDDVDGHALTIDLLGRYLTKAHNGDVRRRDRVNLTNADAKVRGGHAFKTIGAYETWLASGGVNGQRQLAILRLLGLFDRPASDDCLAALRREPVIEGLTESLVLIEEADWNTTVGELGDCRLLAIDGSAIDSHPIVREHFAQRLRDEQPNAWEAAHGRLFDHLKNSPEHWPHTVVGLQPFYQAVVHGCHAGRVQEACDDIYFFRILRRDEFFSLRRLGAYGADLGAVACFFLKPWTVVSPSLADRDQDWMLSMAAVCLRAVGRSIEAVEAMRAALRPSIERGHWEAAAIRSSNLSDLELTLGNISAAIRAAEQSIEFAERSTEFLRMTTRVRLATALNQAGRRADALARFREAEGMQAKRESDFPLLYSGQGFAYCDVLLAGAERATARAGSDTKLAASCRTVHERASRTLGFAMQHHFGLLSIALDHLSLGRARLYQALLERTPADVARSEIERAVDGLRRAGDQDEIPRGLLTRAWLRSAMGDQLGARSDLDEAQEIAERGPMPLHLADIKLYRARLFHDRAALAEARRLIDKHGYERRRGELEDAEEMLNQ